LAAALTCGQLEISDTPEIKKHPSPIFRGDWEG